MHVVPHAMPVGLLVTVPVPVPARVTVKVRAAVKVAATDVSLIRLTYPQAWDMGGKTQKVFNFLPVGNGLRLLRPLQACLSIA